MTVVRAAWLTLGMVALGLGALGVVLPLLPTTPFVLLAAFAFARGSRRWHGWLLGHRLFGPLIDNWHRHRAITRGAKASALVAMAAVLALSLLLGVGSLVLAAQALALIGTAAFLLTRPSPPGSSAPRSPPPQSPPPQSPSP